MKVKPASIVCSFSLFLFFNCSHRPLNMDLLSTSPTGIEQSRWSPDHVWVPAHYEYKEGEHIRVRGRYEYRPRYKSKWAPAHNRKTPRGKIWIDDRWQ